MRVGLFAPPWGPGALPDDLDALAQSAESLGYPTLWVGDHLVIPRTVSSRYLYNESGVAPFDPDQPLLDPITLIAYLAGRTARLRLGISILVLPLRNPVETAKTLADLHLLSRGRLVLGVGVGWMREEFEALQADYEERGEVTDEYLAILRHLWDGKREGFEGRHYRFDPLGFEPRPGHIPIIVGGNSPAATRRAARHDGWHAIRMTADELAPRIVAVRKMAEGRDGFQIVHRGSLLDSEALRAGPDRAEANLPAQVHHTLEAYRSIGVDEFIVEFPDVPTELRIAWMAWLADRKEM